MMEMVRRIGSAMMGRTAPVRKRTKGEKKRSTRERRRAVAGMLAKGK